MTGRKVRITERKVRITGREVRMTGREVRITEREVRMTEDRTSIVEIPIRIQSVTKGMRTVVMTKNLAMTGCVVQEDV
jgi:hypothetical protein